MATENQGETWQAEDDDIVSRICISDGSSDYVEVIVAMMGVVDREKEKLLRDRIIADHAQAQRVQQAIDALEELYEDTRNQLMGTVLLSDVRHVLDQLRPAAGGQ